MKYIVVFYFDTEKEQEFFIEENWGKGSFKYFVIDDSKEDILPISWELSQKLANEE